MAEEAPSKGAQSALEHRFWTNWFLLLGVSTLTTIGLAAGMRPLLAGRTVGPWPWVETEYILLIGISIVVCAFAGYLTHQQRQIAAVRRRFQRLVEQTVERTHRHYTRLLALLNVTRILGSNSDPQRVFDCITNFCMEVFDCQQASLTLLDKESGDLEVRSATGHANLADVLSSRQRIGEGLAGWAAEHREPLLLNSHLDVARYPGLQLTHRSISAAMVVPIMRGEELMGVLNVSSRCRGTHYDQEDIRALQVFAENAGTCIRLHSALLADVNPVTASTGEPSTRCTVASEDGV
jgi:transcriptional regulator with GAF, ATPase, and Fis domain